jgi:hypothetical protein
MTPTEDLINEHKAIKVIRKMVFMSDTMSKGYSHCTMFNLILSIALKNSFQCYRSLDRSSFA